MKLSNYAEITGQLISAYEFSDTGILWWWLKSVFFWDMMPCSLVQIYWRFTDNYWHDLSWWNSTSEVWSVKPDKKRGCREVDKKGKLSCVSLSPIKAHGQLSVKSRLGTVS